MVLLFRTLWCFDIRALLKETNLLPASGQDGCVESHSPDQIPHGRWATGPIWARLPSSCLLLPLIHPLHFPSQGLFHLELLEIPPSVERHPSLALSSHFRQTCDSAQNEYDKHLNLSGLAKWLLTGAGEGNALTGKMFMPWRLKTCKHGLGTIFQGLSSQTEQEHVCLPWQTRQGLRRMFSIQIHSCLATAQLYCFRDKEQCTVTLQWSTGHSGQGPITLCENLLPNKWQWVFAHFYYIINRANGCAGYITND